MNPKRLFGLAGLVMVVVVLAQEHELFASELQPIGPLLATAERVCPTYWQSKVLHDTATWLRGRGHWDEGLPAGSAPWNEARYQEACRIIVQSQSPAF